MNAQLVLTINPVGMPQVSGTYDVYGVLAALAAADRSGIAYTWTLK